jgi:LysR family transcriptional regulator, glycine cleavage system transcriptional activator
MPNIRNARLVRSLQFFEAVARLGSFARAADELGVSASAVSHQIADLRRSVGEDLLLKSGRGIVLTPAGQAMAAQLSSAFNMLETSVLSTIGGQAEVVSVAVCSAFGPYWLAPRLPALKKVRPNIELELRLYAHDPELTYATADCIVATQTVKLGYDSIDLFQETLIPVAAPSLVGGDAVSGMPLITIDPTEADLGRDWLTYGKEQGLTISPDQKNWIRCSHFILALEACKAGLGAALLPDYMAASAISDGKLVRLNLPSIKPKNRVFKAFYKESRASDATLQAVISWMKRTL